MNTHDHPLEPVSPVPSVADAARSSRARTGADESDAPTDPGTPDHADLYVSRHGVLVDPDTGEALALGTQAEVFEWLFHRLRDDLLAGSPEQICDRLAAGSHAADLTEHIHAAGLAGGAWPGDRYTPGTLTDGGVR